MIRKDLELQRQVIRWINEIGWNPFDKPIDLLEWDDVCYLKRLRSECA